jgi:multicomponent Na+:H+ antiporter subunit F
MKDFFLWTSFVMGLIILVPFYRVWKGPTSFDRLLGASAIGAKTLVLVVGIGFIFGRIDMFIDIALAYAILNFVGVIATAKYIESSQE